MSRADMEMLALSIVVSEPISGETRSIVVCITEPLSSWLSKDKEDKEEEEKKTCHQAAAD